MTNNIPPVQYMGQNVSNTTAYLSLPSQEKGGSFDIMKTLQCIIASIGIVANLTVVLVFLNHKTLRRKIPNRFIINQVCIM